MENTLVIIKPDATKRNLVGQIISRFEATGFEISAIKQYRFDLDKALHFYEGNKGFKGYEENSEFMSSGRLVCIIFQKDNAIKDARALIGSWDPAKALPGTIRKDFGIPDRGILDVVHASDSPESARREIALIFGSGDVSFDTTHPLLPWQEPPLNEWSLVGMNHYFIGGEKRLYIALVKNDVCIKEEGPDARELWRRLKEQAKGKVGDSCRT